MSVAGVVPQICRIDTIQSIVKLSTSMGRILKNLLITWVYVMYVYSMGTMSTTVIERETDALCVNCHTRSCCLILRHYHYKQYVLCPISNDNNGIIRMADWWPEPMLLPPSICHPGRSSIKTTVYSKPSQKNDAYYEPYKKSMKHSLKYREHWKVVKHNL